MLNKVYIIYFTIISPLYVYIYIYIYMYIYVCVCVYHKQCCLIIYIF